jgi:type IV pilus assembly protein PilY1
MSAYKAIPQILLVLSKDLKMFQQAYNELIDMDGDGRIDTGFNPAVVYYGYFDSLSCYKYVGTVNRGGDSNGYFIRSGPTIEDDSPSELERIRNRSLGGDSVAVKAARSSVGICQAPHSTQSGSFSGNWLNYLVTSRVDVIRKVLYGGFRQLDTPVATVLEPSWVPRDSNSWGTDVLADNRWEAETPMTNYYDISKFTPFPKPARDKAHFFARTRNTSGAGVFQVLETLLDADKKSFLVSSTITGDNGRYFDWVLQDGPNPSSTRLATPSKIRGYGLKVRVCEKGNLGEGEDCRHYPRGGFKPVGLLQKNGESGEMHFGLLSGSYDEETRIQGGVLRNHIDHINRSVDMDNYGQIIANGLIWNLDTFMISGAVTHTGLQTYQNSGSWGNPIGEMLFEGVRYMARLAQGDANASIQPTPLFLPRKELKYNPKNQADFIRDWRILPPLAGRECAKPIILLISEVDSEYDGDSAINEFNDLDMDILSSVSAIEAPNLPRFQLRHYLDRITALENLDLSKEYIFARDRLDECSPKPLKSLAEVSGICPYRTSYEGTYSAAALAYFARTHNFGQDGREVSLDVYTVTMSSAFPSLEFPLFDAGGSEKGKISILPASMSDTSKLNSVGRILSFLNYYILEWWVDQKGMPYHVKIKVNYEDSAQGHNKDFYGWPNSDWDMDVMIEHTIDLVTKSSRYRDSTPMAYATMARASGALKRKGGTYYAFRKQGQAPFSIDPNEVVGLSIKSWKANNSTGEKMALGYTVSGSTHDGTYMDLGHCGGIATHATPPTCDWPKGYGVNSSSDVGTKCKTAFGECPGWGKADNKILEVIRTFEFNPDPAASGERLPNPLYLAAKYGGYHDGNRNGRPDPGEWEGADGVPRAYFQSFNLSQLPIKLEAAFRDISQTVNAASATASAVNTVLGGGQAILTAFYPKYVSPVNSLRAVSWVGTVYGLFMDKFGYLREDTNGDHKLTLDCPAGSSSCDHVVSFNSSRGQPDIKPKCYAQGSSISRCVDEKGDGVLTPASGGQAAPKTIHHLKPVWDAGRWLAELKDLDKRHVYFVDAEDPKNIMVAPWVADPPTVSRLKNVLIHANTGDTLPSLRGPGTTTSPQDYASALIRYVRGEDIPHWRSRTIGSPWDNEKTEIVWRMGDTINSKPIIVGPPSFNYERLYHDKSYAAYKAAQSKRRQVAYFGSNDGFLRAINLGYFGTMGSGEVSYDPGGLELGAEMWALIPWSTLPHLQWLPDPGYVHAYYVDMKPVVADIKINGQWRTILICGLRLGGRAIEAPTSTEADPKFIFSEIMALDVTDPRPGQPPKILWRFSSDRMGLLAGLPAVVTSGGQWRVVVASGPSMDRLDANQEKLLVGSHSPYEGYSDQNARLIVLDAATGEPLAGLTNDQLVVPEANSFFNDPYVPLPLKREKQGVWHDETIYYGLTVSRDSAALDKGAVYRLQMVDQLGAPLPTSQWRLKLLASVDRPVTGAVNSALDSHGNLWVIFGTGRLWGVEDIKPCSKVATSQCKENHEQYLFGIKEELSDGRMTFASRDVKKLADISNGQVYNNGLVVNLDPFPGLALGPGGATNYQKFAQALRDPRVDGYKRRLNLTNIINGGQTSLEIAITQPQITSAGTNKSILGFTTYELTAQSCGDFGRGFMYVLDTFTGLPAPYLALSFASKVGVAGEGLIPGGVSTGFGQPTGAIAINVDGKVIIRSSTSENASYDVEVASERRFLKDLIVWRESLNTGLELSEEIMTEKLQENPRP